MTAQARAYQPLTLAGLAVLLTGADETLRWRLIAEFPFNTRAARADALVHAPAAFRRRGVYLAPQELEVA